jgi:hypothetical protein
VTRSTTRWLAAGGVLAAAAWLIAQEPAKDAKAKDQECTQSKQAKSVSFDKLKALAGEWRIVVPPDAKEQPPAGDKPHIIYSVIAAGTVVHEHMFPGTEHEMVTMYHLDGPTLMLTHYCAAGNQPQMKAEAGADEKQVVFKFAGGTNLDVAKDGHMHDLTVKFIDADHIRQEWTYYQDGKAAGGEKFNLERVKAGASAKSDGAKSDAAKSESVKK